MMPTYDSLLASRGAKQLSDLNLSSLAKESGIEEALLIANPTLLLAALRGEPIELSDKIPIDNGSNPLIK